MSSAEKNREVFENEDDGFWYYQVWTEKAGSYSPCFGPYETEAKATEAMQLHGLQE